MKKASLISLIVLILLVSISFLFFHDRGNEYLKPYVANYLETKLDQDISVKIKHLKIDLEYVEFVAVLNDLTKVKAQGEIKLFSQTLDINYTLKSDGFKTLDNKVNINGTVIGAFNNLNIKGAGETLKSHINYALNVKDDVINNIKVNIKKADIASILELVAQPAYAKGKVDINIKIPTLKEVDTKGKAKIVLYKTMLNKKVFKNEFNIDLPKKTIITANIDSKISADTFELEGDIKSNLASIKLSKTIYTLRNKELLTDYTFLAPNLSKLMFLTKQKFNGNLQLTGNLFVKKNAFNIQANSKSLGGEIDFNSNGKKLNLDMKNIKIAKLLYLLGEKPYATGRLMADVKISDLENLAGTFRIKTEKAKTINHSLKKELNLDFGKAIAFSLNSKGDISSNIVSIQSSFNSDIFNYRSDDMKYDIKNVRFSSTYLFDIAKLSGLNTVVGKTLKGSLAINGKMNYDKTLNITGSTKSLGGDINFNLKNQKINAKINNVLVKKLMYTLDYPQIFQAILIGDFKYDLNTRQGSFTSKLNKAQLLSNQLTVLVKQIRGLDLTKERYNETEFNALLNKQFIDINFKAKSKRVVLEIPTGRIDKITNNIDANYKIYIDNKDIGGKIKGNISKPSITFDSSSFFQDKLMDAIRGELPNDTFKDLSLEQIQPDTIKDTVENLFGGFFK